MLQDEKFQNLLQLAGEVEETLFGRFREIDTVAQENSFRILSAFRENLVSDSHFAGTTGYGYDDLGREALDKIYAQVFGAPAALVRLGFVNGTHALTAALFACLSPGETLLSVTGAPYDTLQGVIGIEEGGFGTLRFYGIAYDQVDLTPEGCVDFPAIREKAARREVGAVFIQRSRGYGQRRALTVDEIGKIVQAVKAVNPNAYILCDNCYGEFCETKEPTAVGVDLMAGSLIKNPGGGLAPTGGYIAGQAALVERAAERLTAPGIGGECGSTLGQNRLLLQGFLMAPHTVAQALKSAALCAGVLQRLGYETSPGPLEKRSDIIQMVSLGSAERLERFCRGIQHGSPVDAFVTPEPWQMPGYDCPVIMAAGTFIQGASIELSCDGPMRAPYSAYLQGGLTYEMGKYGVLMAISEMLDE